MASTFGFVLAQVCLLWIIYSSTHSALLVAYVGVAATAGGLTASIAAGPFLDRTARGPWLVLANAGRAVATVVLIVGLELFGVRLLLLAPIAFTVAALTALFDPAESALIAEVVPLADRPSANSLVGSSRASVAVVASALAGALILVAGARIGLVGGALLFAVSAAVVAGAAPRPSGSGTTPPGNPRSTTWASDLADGLGWLGRHRGFLAFTLASMAFNFFAVVFTTFLVFYAGALPGASGAVFGGLLAALALGSAFGPLLAARRSLNVHLGPVWLITYGLVPGALVLLVVLVPELAVAAAALAGFGVVQAIAGTLWLTGAQAVVPREVQGRVFAADYAGSMALLPVAEIVGGLLVAGWGVRSTYLLVGALWVAGGVVCALIPSLRRFRALPIEPERT